METIIQNTDPVLLIGEGELTASVAMCLLKAGHKLDVYTPNEETFRHVFDSHVDAAKRNTSKFCDIGSYTFCSSLSKRPNYKLAIVISAEDLKIKREWVRNLTEILDKNTIIAINTESFALNDLRANSINDRELIGLNWTDPAHTTFFLEIISDKGSEIAEDIKILAKSYWGKDPYIVIGSGIRSRLISAMAREASYLIDNGYASVDDIDRACRNDAGYYLPFAGNCRYMDLMGTYAYGMVMKDLNPDLSKEKKFPEFLTQILEAGGQGMESGKGFYNYTEADIENWKRTIEDFSYQIQVIIEKYPFNYNKAPFTD